MITAANITIEAIVALAKCKAATCMRAGGKRIDPEVAKLTFLLGHNHKVNSRLLIDLQGEGLIRWSNGTTITVAGDVLLAEILKARSAGR